MFAFGQKETKVLSIDLWLSSYLDVVLDQGVYSFCPLKVDCCSHAFGIEID